MRNIHFRIKGKLFKLYLILLGCKIGKNLKCKQFPIFRSIPYKNIEIGDNVNFGYRITLDIQTSGKLKLGNRVNLTQDIVISSIESVEIGHNTLIAENVSIRDGDHQFKLGSNINIQPLTSSKINIGNDVWIAAGTRVLKGATLPDGCIIGANSLVIKKSKLEQNKIYAGTPVVEISKR
jgi:acetyltransferase-like isoleucine patch superfamily enzyme